MSDKDILSLYNEGHQERAFNEIVSAYGERLYWHVRTLVCRHEDADDLMQDIFVKIWQSLPGFREESGLFTWLYRIATNETLNFLKKKKVKSLLLFENFSELFDRRIDEDQYFNGDEAQRRLTKAIAKLPPKQRAVFYLRYYDEMPYEQISEIMNTSVSSLKASYHFAFSKVKDELTEKSEE